MKFKTLRDLVEGNEEDTKLGKTPQVAIILSHLPKVGAEIERADLVAAIDGDEKFESRQGGDKVLNFYTPKLIKAGLVEKIADAPAEAAEGETETKAKTSKGKGKKAGEAKAEAADAEAEAA